MTYLFRRKATPVKNTENVQAAERKEDQNAAVMSYATLNDGTTNTMYENVPEDGLYDSPYSLSGSTYGWVETSISFKNLSRRKKKRW